jgi:riboflavin biosynthesis pyrimidine reductase
MRFEQVWPAAAGGSAEDFFTGLALAQDAANDRPYVVTNFVGSLDGKATAAGRTGPLSDDGDRAAFLLLRTQVDAVLVGTGTLAIERYGPLIADSTHAAVRAAAGLPPQPPLVIVSRRGEIPFDIPLFAHPEASALIYSPVPPAVPTGLRARVVVDCESAAAGDLRGVLASLHADHGVRSVLCEGGPHLLSALLAADLVDEFFLTLSPMLIGGGELGITAGPRLDRTFPLHLIRALVRNDHLLLRYGRVAPPT